MSRVRFFCDCGKEIWDELPEYQKSTLTIAEAEASCICSDCILNRVIERRRAKTEGERR